MKTTIQATKLTKQKRFLMILPLLTLPFLTMMFWAFGGGREKPMLSQSTAKQGLNLKLPDAKLKEDKGLNKLSFYQQAALDSVKTKAAEKLDPYWKKNFNEADSDNNYNTGLLANGMDANQAKVYNKLDELRKALNESETVSKSNTQPAYHSNSRQLYSSSNDAERLQAMILRMKEDKDEDPDLDKLNKMLDKIQSIQHPAQSADSNQTIVRRNFSVAVKNRAADISLMKTGENNIAVDTNVIAPSNNAFYGVTTFNNNNDSISNNAIESVIPETQTIVAGSTIKLALSNDVTIVHTVLPAGTLIYGTASLSNERLKIKISSIRFQSLILPVTLEVYDMDGQPGIYIPGSINRTVAKESAGHAIGGMDVTTVDPSIGAQATSAGIEAAKTLLDKKVKLIKMTVKAGYKVLLVNNQSNNF